MLLPNPKDAIHKAWMYRVLSAIYDDQTLSRSLYFKGGTCAAMRGLLDRFSIDLDFDYVAPEKEMAETRKKLELIFADLGMTIKDSSKNAPQYFLKYPVTRENERNTIKIDATFPPIKANLYEPARLNDIDRIVFCQTIETMFVNKLVALIDRWEKSGSIAGRDMYDIHHFFLKGYRYNKDVIVERRNDNSVKEFFRKLIGFIEKEITETIINQDINTLLPLNKFQRTRKILKRETLMFLNDEIRRFV